MSNTMPLIYCQRIVLAPGSTAQGSAPKLVMTSVREVAEPATASATATGDATYIPCSVT